MRVTTIVELARLVNHLQRNFRDNYPCRFLTFLSFHKSHDIRITARSAKFQSTFIFPRAPTFHKLRCSPCLGNNQPEVDSKDFAYLEVDYENFAYLEVDYEDFASLVRTYHCLAGNLKALGCLIANSRMLVHLYLN